MTAANSRQTPPLTADVFLRQLDELAAVEHTLCVDRLTVSYILGRLLPAGAGNVIDGAAQAAFTMAIGDMRHLQRVNGVLTAAGRRPQVGRATRLDAADGSALPLGTVAADLHHLVEHQARVARAVEARYRALEPALDPATGVLADELLEVASSALPGCAEHAAAVEDGLVRPLADVPASEYLRVTRTKPDGRLEETLLALSDRHYQLVVEMVAASFSYDEELGGQLIGRATSLMQLLDDHNTPLVERGLLPRLALANSGYGD